MNRSRCISISLAVILLLLPLIARAAEDEEKQTSEPEKKHTRIVLYPILAQAPIFGAKVKLPALPGQGGGGNDGNGGGVSNSSEYATDLSLNAAYLVGATFERDRLFVDFAGSYAGLSAERQSPLLKVDSKIYYFYVIGGWQLYRDLAVTGGVKRVALNLHLTFNNSVGVRTKPGVWDPLVGVDWRRRLTRKLWLNANAQVGGFGAGTDLETTGKFIADWEFAPHVLLDLGYDFLYFKTTVAKVDLGTFQRKLVAKQTLHGPRIGLGITW